MKFLRQILLQVASGLILYGIVWMLENSELGQQLLVATVETLTTAGRLWVAPLVVTSLVIVVLAICSWGTAKWAPLPKGVGIDRDDATFALGGFGRLLLGCASVSLAAAIGLHLMDGNVTWGLTLLAAAALAAATGVWRSVDRVRRFLRAGF